MVVVSTAMTAVIVSAERTTVNVEAPALVGESNVAEGQTDIGSATKGTVSHSEPRPVKARWNHLLLDRWIFSVWVAGVLLFSLFHLFGWRRALRLAEQRTTKVPEEWQDRFARLQNCLKVSRTVRLACSSLVRVPCVVEWIKPIVLIPLSMLSSLAPREIEMILVHELAHIRRHDLLVNILQTAMESLYFFNPAVWWISRQIRIERENVCDDVAVEIIGDKLGYARALTNLEELRLNRTGFATAITGAPFAQRIRRILGMSVPRIHVFGASIPGILLLASLIVVGLNPFEGSDHSAVMADTTSKTSGSHEPKRSGMGGEWEIESHRAKVQIGLYHRQDGRSSLSLDGDELTSQIGDSAESFQVVREAGTYFFEGKIKQSWGELSGKGDWHFQPNRSYVQAMEKYGLRSDDENKLFTLAIFDVNLSFVSEMEKLGLQDLDIDNLISALVHGITPELVEEYQDAGLDNLSAGQLIAAKVHSITPRCVSEFFEAGFSGLSMESIISLHIARVDPVDLRDCEKQGFGEISDDDLVILCMSEVEPEYIRGLEELNYRHLAASDLASMKDADITLRYIRDLAELGYESLSSSLLVRMRESDVTPSLIRKLRNQGKSDMTPADLIEYQRTGH